MRNVICPNISAYLFYALKNLSCLCFSGLPYLMYGVQVFQVIMP